jgi:hypothetical protein
MVFKVKLRSSVPFFTMIDRYAYQYLPVRRVKILEWVSAQRLAHLLNQDEQDLYRYALDSPHVHAACCATTGELWFHPDSAAALLQRALIGVVAQVLPHTRRSEES